MKFAFTGKNVLVVFRYLLHGQPHLYFSHLFIYNGNVFVFYFNQVHLLYRLGTKQGGAVVFYHNELCFIFFPILWIYQINETFPKRLHLCSIEHVENLLGFYNSAVLRQISSAYHIARCSTIHLEAKRLSFNFHSSEDFFLKRLFGDCIDAFFFGMSH